MQDHPPMRPGKAPPDVQQEQATARPPNAANTGPQINGDLINQSNSVNVDT